MSHDTTTHADNHARRTALLAALAVFLGGASYGFAGPIIKTAGQAGFHWTQIMPAQSFSGLLLFAIAFLISLACGKRWVHVTRRDVVMLLLLGASTGLTNLCYNIALTRISAQLGVTLLFQYVWMGIIIQIIISKKSPRVLEVIAAIVVLGGTVGASGLLDSDLELDALGLVAGLLSALGYAIFLLLSGKAGNTTPPMQRGLITCVGSCIVAIIVCPNFFFGGVDLIGIAPYGLGLGVAALLLPVPLMGYGAQRISGSACNILASSELPATYVIAAIWLGEAMGPGRIIGAIVILVGIALTQITPTRKKKQAD